MIHFQICPIRGRRRRRTGKEEHGPCAVVRSDGKDRRNPVRGPLFGEEGRNHFSTVEQVHGLGNDGNCQLHRDKEEANVPAMRSAQNQPFTRPHLRAVNTNG
jgi:hypothetical protein